MFLQSRILTSTGNYSDEIKKLREKLSGCDAVIIGAGAGLSTSAGFTYSGKRFKDNFSDFQEKYGFNDMYTGGFYTFETIEENWAYWSRFIYLNRYTDAPKDTYKRLFNIVKDKEYFVITTNVDHQFQKAGFDKNRLFYTQGDYGLFQCSKPCHNKTYDNEKVIKKMYELQKDMKILSELVPRCPECGREMTMNLRKDDTFVQDEGWYKASYRYREFLNRFEGKRILFLELGVGFNTPVIIKYPFWQMTAENKNAFFACINFNEGVCPGEIKDRSAVINEDISKAINDISAM